MGVLGRPRPGPLGHRRYPRTIRARGVLHDVMKESCTVTPPISGATAGYADERLAFVDTELPTSMTSSIYHDLEQGDRLKVSR